MDDSGHGDFEHELISIDDQWRRDATDAVAEELRSAGFKVKERLYLVLHFGTTGHSILIQQLVGTCVH